MSKCIICGNELLTGDIHWEMGLCNKCYNELYKDHNTHISLDKMWLKLTQDFRDENEQLQTKITDLQSQLAEKDKRIKQLKLDLGMFKSVNEFINGYGIEKAREVLLQTEKTKNQDKISFALEQLEKVKVQFVSEKWDLYDTSDLLEQVCELRNAQLKFIDNLINELKGEK